MPRRVYPLKKLLVAFLCVTILILVLSRPRRREVGSKPQPGKVDGQWAAAVQQLQGVNEKKSSFNVNERNRFTSVKPQPVDEVLVHNTERVEKLDTVKPKRRTVVAPTEEITSDPAEEEEFNMIFTTPLNDSHFSSHYLLLPPMSAAERKKNRIAKLYESIVPSKDSFFADNEAFWEMYSDLKDVFSRFQTLNEEMRTGKRKKRYVTVRPVGQLCNRLMAITSAFVFALITGRGLQVEDSGFYARMGELFEQPGFSWTVDFVDSVGGQYIQNPESGVWSETEKLLCGRYEDVYAGPYVHFAINQYTVPYYTSNPYYRPAFLQLFRGENVFLPVSRFLFRPIEKLRKMRRSYMKKNFANNFVVGLQVRSGADFTSHFMKEADWMLYKRCGEKSTPREMRNKLKYFVATDTKEGREAAKKYLGEDNVIFGPGEFLISDHPEGVQMALLDLLLLASANDRVHTAWSSFGYFAAGYSGLPANLVTDKASRLLAKPGEEQRFMGVPHKSDRRVQCVRLPTQQPCFHKYESWGASKTTCFSQKWIEREMLNGRYC